MSISIITPFNPPNKIFDSILLGFHSSGKLFHGQKGDYWYTNTISFTHTNHSVGLLLFKVLVSKSDSTRLLLYSRNWYMPYGKIIKNACSPSCHNELDAELELNRRKNEL